MASLVVVAGFLYLSLVSPWIVSPYVSGYCYYWSSDYLFGYYMCWYNGLLGGGGGWGIAYIVSGRGGSGSGNFATYRVLVQSRIPHLMFEL